MTSPLDYAARGWRVFPCYEIERGICSCSRGRDCPSPGKHPRPTNGVKDATANPQLIQTWMERFPHANWAVACGLESGIIVIDIDPRKNGFGSIEELETMRPEGPLPETLRSLTGGAGRHLFYTYPEGSTLPNRTNWLPGIDVKSNGGYVILPDSNHISGGVYQWENWGQSLAPLPSDILQAFIATAGSGSTLGDLPDTDDILAGVEEGQRDDTLFRAACRWRRQLGDSGKSAVMALALQAAAACDPPFPADQARKCVEQAFKQDHSDDWIEWQHGTDEGDGDDHATDLGNAKRFIKYFGDRLRYVRGWGWVSWSDIGWHRDADSYAAELAHAVPDKIREEARMITDDREQRMMWKWAMTSESSGHLSAITKIASERSGIGKTVDEFDAKDDLINCRNGIVDLRTGEMRMITQDDLVTKNTGVMYDPTFKLDAWDNFLLESCEGDVELVEYLQRAAGYTLTGANTEECFFIISGPPASGKSTFLDALHAALGGYACSTNSETITYQRNQQPPVGELARFAGMRMVTVSEVREGAGFNETLIKQFTGGDRVTARFLYRDAFEYRPQMKLWIGTNHDPDTRDDAMWRRLKKVAFRHSVPSNKRDPRLKTMLQDPEVGGKAVLAWAVDGAKKWYDDGLKEPAQVTLEVRAYHAEQDRTAQFIRECLVQTPGNVVQVGDMYMTWQTWCRSMGEFPTKALQMRKALESRGVKTGMDDRGKIVFKDVASKQMILGPNGVQWS